MSEPLPWHVSEAEWYATTLAHWQSSQAVTSEGNDGVLGGWAEVDEEDVRGSLSFLAGCLTDGREITKPLTGFRALDCGAGVGRVTAGVLLRAVENVHLVEVSEHLLGQARTQLAAHGARVEYEQASLREFAPTADSYNLVWAQWVLGHLTDTDVVGLLSRCRAALRPDGIVVVKDNTAAPSDCDQGGGRYLLDIENAAVIRTHAHFRSIFKLAGLRLVRSEVQQNFPEDLHPVRMYFLSPN